MSAIIERTSPSARKVIEKAFQELEPLVAKENGLAPTVLRSALNKTGGLLKQALKGLGSVAVGGALGATGKGIYDEFTRK